MGLGSEHRLQPRLRRIRGSGATALARLRQDGLPPVVAQNAAAAGTSITGYLSESPAVSASDAGRAARAGRRCPAQRQVRAGGRTMDTQ
jgi:hypothetical protein